MTTKVSAARAEVLKQLDTPRPGAWFAEGVMDAVGLAIGFDGYCLFGVDPLTGIRNAMFSRNGLQVSSERLIHNETVDRDANRYLELVAGPQKAAILAGHGPCEPKSQRLHEILRPEGYHSELRVVFASQGQYWGAASLFRDERRHPFTDEDAQAAHELCEPLGLAIRRYHVGHRGHAVQARPTGVVLFDNSGEVLDVSPEARAWLSSLADSWETGATENDVLRVVLEVADAAAGRTPNPPLCRVRLPTGEWLVVSGSQVNAGGVGVVVMLQPGDVATVVPAFAIWCGLTPKQTDVLGLIVRGLSTKQVARDLSLSILTVNDHLRAIYRKAGVRGRDELMALLV